MSKSYDNTVPLFDGGSKRTREAIMRIVTDSRAPGEPKDPDSSSLYDIYRAFAGADEAGQFRSQLAEGMAWGDAKKVLSERVEAELAPMRDQYQALMARPDDIEGILEAGAAKARSVATPLLGKLREAVGLGKGNPGRSAQSGKRKAVKAPRITSFRDEDRRFRFSLLAANGDELVRSAAYQDPRSAGLASRGLIDPVVRVDTREEDRGRLVVMLGREVLAYTPVYDDQETRRAAAERLSSELRALAAGGEG